jgi:hypothetical protein
VTVQYEPKVIEEFAASLYAQADSIIVGYSLLGVLVGGAGGYVVGMLPWFSTIATVFGFLLGGLVGFVTGKAKAFNLRLQAQQALCQVRIEANTRALQEAFDE